MKKTPTDRWQNTIINYKKKCQNILKLSNNIRYAGVINAYGRTLTGVIKPNLKPLLKSEEVKNEFFIVFFILDTSCSKFFSLGLIEI